MDNDEAAEDTMLFPGDRITVLSDPDVELLGVQGTIQAYCLDIHVYEVQLDDCLGLNYFPRSSLVVKEPSLPACEDEDEAPGHAEISPTQAYEEVPRHLIVLRLQKIPVLQLYLILVLTRMRYQNLVLLIFFRNA